MLVTIAPHIEWVSSTVSGYESMTFVSTLFNIKASVYRPSPKAKWVCVISDNSGNNTESKQFATKDAALLNAEMAIKERAALKVVVDYER